MQLAQLKVLILFYL